MLNYTKGSPWERHNAPNGEHIWSGEYHIADFDGPNANANAKLCQSAPKMYSILDAIRDEQVDGISRQIWIKRETLKILTEMEGRIDGN